MFSAWPSAKYVTTLVWESGMNFKNEWVVIQVFVPEAPHSPVVFVFFLYELFYSSNQEKKKKSTPYHMTYEIYTAQRVIG